MPKLSYEVPEKREDWAEVAESIPSNWCWVNGFLTAPKKLYEEKRIAENTRLVIEEFSKSPFIKGADDVPYEDINIHRREREHLFFPRVVDVILRGKLCSSISFTHVGYERDRDNIEMVKELSSGLIKEGFMGYMKAYSGYEDNKEFHNPETFSFGVAYLGGNTPRYINLEWDERYGGRRENLNEIIERLERLRLKELQSQGA